MADYYPFDEQAREPEPVRTSVRLAPDVQEDIKFFALLWNEFDKALGRRRSKKWKAASVIERLVLGGLEDLWKQYGGKPPSAAAREQLKKKAIEQIKSMAAKK